MGILAAVKAIKQERSVPIAVPVGDEVCRFRPPTIADVEPALKAGEALAGNFPDVDTNQLFEIAIIGVCYLPEEYEGEVNAVALVAEIASGNEFAYIMLRDAFMAAYPGFVEWVANRAKAALEVAEAAPEAPAGTAQETAPDADEGATTLPLAKPRRSKQT